ncbi:MAG: hypothetical protein IPM91_20860 [Bacteroidetes bacterium]|nr:hypothetical protein [Bacteroidota bacterium]
MKTMNSFSSLQQLVINFGESRQTGGELLHLDLIFADYFEMRGGIKLIRMANNSKQPGN